MLPPHCEYTFNLLLMFYIYKDNTQDIEQSIVLRDMEKLNLYRQNLKYQIHIKMTHYLKFWINPFKTEPYIV